MRARTAAEHVRRHAALPPTDSLSPVVGMGLERTDLDASAIRDEEHSPVSPMAEWFETGLDLEEESMSRLQAAPRGTARRAPAARAQCACSDVLSQCVEAPRPK